MNDLIIWSIMTAVILFLRNYCVFRTYETFTGLVHVVYYWDKRWFTYVPTVWFSVSLFLVIVRYV